jgi:hypothetical protein
LQLFWQIAWPATTTHGGQQEVAHGSILDVGRQLLDGEDMVASKSAQIHDRPAGGQDVWIGRGGVECPDEELGVPLV